MSIIIHIHISYIENILFVSVSVFFFFICYLHTQPKYPDKLDFMHMNGTQFTTDHIIILKIKRVRTQLAEQQNFVIFAV